MCGRVYAVISLLFISSVIVLGTRSSPNPSWWRHHPFDVAMQKMMYFKEIALTELVMQIDGVELYTFFKKLYDVNNPSMICAGSTVKIPKIIHQIWLGSPVPDVYRELMQTWIDNHPDWLYILWTDEDVHEIILYNRALYDETENYGTKSDILRWEILYQYGGLYVDVDYQCLQPFDALHYLYDFYTGIQPLDTHMVQLGAALVGACPAHPILKYCIETIKDHWHLKGAPKKTGPVHFTQSFYAMAGKQGMVDIAFPALYVYPLGCQEKVEDHCMEQWIKQGSFAIHWWSKSWMPKEYRPARFRVIDNSTSASHWND